MLKRTTLICTLFAATLTGFSQENKTVDLDPVTISATLSSAPASRTGRNVIVVKGETFQFLPVHSIDELLRFVPGVEVQQRGPAGSQSDIVLRGGTFQQVLVILDGIRLNDPNTGHFSSYIPIAPAEIERIEILKGASSAVYGSEAVGGVIHIITKSFAARNKEIKNQFGISVMAGEYDLYSGSAGGHWQKNKTALSGGVLSNNSDGRLQRGARGFFNNHTASLSLKHFFNDNWNVAVRSSFDQRKFSAQNFYTTFASDTADEKVTTNWNQARINYQKGKHNVSLDAGYKYVKDIFLYNPQSTPNNNRSNLLQLLLSDHYKCSGKTTISTGLQFQYRKIKSNDRGNHSLQRLAGFIVLNQKWNEFTFSPSIRLDGDEFVPQINLSYHLHKFQVRASVGKTIRDADFTERYNNYNKTFVSGGSIGNPDLVAERSFSYEAGADYFATDHLKLSVTGFQRRQTNLIDWVTTPYSEMPRKDNLSPAGTYALAKNISKVNTTGVEADLQYSNKNFHSTLGLIWLNSDVSSGTKSFYISSHAKLLANFSAEYIHKRFSIGMTAIYKNREHQEATAIHAHIDEHCFMMNWKAGFFLIKNKLSIITELDNVLDNTCADILGTRAPGRWWMGGIKWNL